MVKKLRFMMTALLMAVCSIGFAAETTETFTPSDFEAVTSTDFSLTLGDITISCSNGTVNADELRVFANQTLTVSTAAGAITKIDFTSEYKQGSKNGLQSFTSDCGNYSVPSKSYTSEWTGSYATIVFTASQQVRISEIVVTYDPEAVVKPDPELSFDPTEIEIDLGDEFTAPTLSAPEGVTVTYESDNENVATVDETTGEVEIVGVGEAVITATSEANDSYSFGSASYLIIVNPYVEKTPAPEGAIFFDAFNHTSYSGGRDGNFTGNAGSGSKITSDATGGVTADNGYCYGAKQCLKFGSANNNGTFTTRAITWKGTAVLTFDAAGWGDKKTNSLAVTVTGADASGDISITLNNGEWSSYSVLLENCDGEFTISFSGKRGFIDDICVMPTELAYTIPNGGLGTLVSDRNLDFSSLNGVNTYYSTGLNDKKNCVAVVKIQGAVEANSPIIIEGSANTKVNIPLAEADASFASISGNMLKGNATESINLDGVNCMIISANDGKFHPCSGGTLAAGKAYLDVDPSELGANAKLSIEEIDADPTAISEVKAQENNGAIYNLQGVRVEKAQKGIYIMNGKKVIVK